MARYILCRPEGGLNDTLTQIELACQYGARTNRQVVVDTAHQSSKHFRDTFGNYFTSTDTNLHLDVSPYVEQFDSMTVYPHFLTGRVSNYTIENSEEQQCWVESTFKRPIVVDYDSHYSEPLLVHQHFGGGSISMDALRRLILKSWLVDALHERLQHIDGSYCGLHIRNSDIKTDYIAVLGALKNIDFGDKLFLATDSRAVLNAFKTEFGDRIITFTELPDSSEPLHYLNNNPAVNNRDSILDLLTLACSERVYITQLHNCNFTNVSGYSLLAHNLNVNKDVLGSLINDSRVKIDA